MRHIFICSCFLLLCAHVWAQDSLNTVGTGRLDSMQYLREVTVYGAKPYSDVIPAQVLSGKALEGLSSHSVADAIRYFSGVQLKDYGGVGGVKTVDMRSMGSNHLGVFYDGIQLGNAQNGQIDLGKFSLDNVEEISLYNGQKSDIFQPARDFGSAGSIYLRTRRPKFSNGKKWNLNVTMRTGSFGLANPSIRYEQKLSRAVRLSANAEYTYATGQYHFRYRKRFSDGVVAWDTTAVRHNGDINALRLEAALFGASDNGKWYWKAYYYNSERGIPGAIVNNVWHNSQRQWDRNFFTQGSWQRRVSDRFETMVNAKYARDMMRYLNPDTTLMYINNRFWQDEIYISSANKFTIIPDWDVSLSADYKWNYLDATLPNFSYPTRHTALAALATARTWRGFKMQASLLYSMVNDRHSSRNNGQILAHHSKYLHKFTPAVFLSYQPFPAIDLSARAFFKRIFRMPTFNDLYYTDIGNATLRPEYVNQWNIGLQWQHYDPQATLIRLKITADAYYNNVTDKILAVPSGRGQYRWMMMNIGRVKIRGIDLTSTGSISLAPETVLELTLNYTYQRAQDYTDPTDCGEGGTYLGQISYVPWHSGSVIGHFGWRRLDVNYSFIYVGERYHVSANIPANHEQPWYTHDLGLSYLLSLKKLKIKITGEVNNLFNQAYDVIHNYPMPGRNYRLTLKFDL